MTKLAIGLVVKGGKIWIKDWITCAERLGDVIIVVDNEADKEVKDILINHPKVKRYVIQKDLERNMSRDYQIILELAREENCDWIWNLDIDEIVPIFLKQSVMFFLVNCEFESVGVPILEMRNDKEHYVMVQEPDGAPRDGRLIHKIYKVLSHFEFDKRDKHGCSIPHNCPRNKGYINLLILHFGHMTKELRNEKRLKIGEDKDDIEPLGLWMEEDESKLTIKHISEAFKLLQEEAKKTLENE